MLPRKPRLFRKLRRHLKSQQPCLQLPKSSIKLRRRRSPLLHPKDTWEYLNRRRSPSDHRLLHLYLNLTDDSPCLTSKPRANRPKLPNSRELRRVLALPATACRRWSTTAASKTLWTRRESCLKARATDTASLRRLERLLQRRLPPFLQRQLLPSQLPPLLLQLPNLSQLLLLLRQLLARRRRSKGVQRPVRFPGSRPRAPIQVKRRHKSLQPRNLVPAVKQEHAKW